MVDDPNAGNGYGQGTFPYAINSSGAVVGWYVDIYGIEHGFVRTPEGTYSDIDVGTINTAAYGINAKGAIGGGYVDRRTSKCPGFLRTPTGHFKKFDPPDDAGTYPYGCAYIGPISKSSTVTGDYYNAQGYIHAFLRTVDGTITEFDAPGASQTWGFGINDSDAIAGPYSDSSGDHGYIRAADGTFTTFDAPGGANRGNIATRINSKGETEGDFLDSNNVVHGTVDSLEYPDASFDCVTMFDVIEHLDDPRLEVGEVWRILRPGGLFVVATPDAGSRFARLLGARWLELKRAPEHLHFFSGATLSLLMRTCGFRPLDHHSMGKITTLRVVFADLKFYAPKAFGALERLLDARGWSDRVVDLNPGTKMCVYASKDGSPAPVDATLDRLERPKLRRALP